MLRSKQSFFGFLLLIFSLSLIGKNFLISEKIIAQSSTLRKPETLVSNPSSSKPKIQIAILLDSSNSMDGLIEQTRTQIWKIINALSHVTKNGQSPILEVALYHYGNDSLPSSEGFNTILNDLTTDLDRVSEKLFSIQTNGGQEYAGWVIQSATNGLNWSQNREDFHGIFIAGNEPFEQGSINWKQSIQLAIDKDILVNTIYCGEAESEESSLWAQAAFQGKGSYFNINQNQTVAFIESPYDLEITELNNQLNQTYIPYGSEGSIGQQRQLEQDSNAGENLALRGVAKSSAYYRNSSWDLVDAVTDNLVKLETLDNAQLPENMRSMSLEQKIKYLENIKAQRASIQKKIALLNQKRTEYIQKLSLNQDSKNTLDSVMIEALRKQLAAKGFILNEIPGSK